VRFSGVEGIHGGHGGGQGVSTYTHVSDQHSTFDTKVIVATAPESHYVLDGLLGNETDLPDPRAAYLFKQASKLHDPHGAGYTLHQLRHSGLTHLAAKGRSAAELQAKSRHRHLATLGIYVRLGEETSARITAENDEHHRRHRR